MKKIIKSFLPSIVLDKIKAFKSPWRGTYVSWSYAMEHCVGYSSETILGKVSESTLQVASGKFPYERDSVLFNEIEYSWPLASALLWTHNLKNSLRVVDFGGSLGSSYFQNRFFLDGLCHLEWNIVEQAGFVTEGKKKFENDILKFELNLQAIGKTKEIDFILLSSSLQYLEKPYELLNDLIEFSPKVIFLDRLSVIEGGHDLLSLQKVPPSIYKASYPCWFFAEERIIKILSEKYKLISRFDSYVPISGKLDGRQFKAVGHFWVRK